MKPVEVHPEAELEFEKGSDYLEEQKPGLGAEFEAEVQAILDRIARMPGAFPLYGSSGLRKGLVKRFSYTIFFMDLEDRIWVAAVAHQKRRPDYWAGRMPD